ncbi:MAG TPA: YdeI/OmpD-associated family protein [Planctomycetota bacterium]|nr:YdeI/OmpD-associated family protein [Planctomycetota bacterium]
MKTLLVRTLDEWRDWLTEHHASVPEIWLIFHKQHTGVASIDYEDALDEALCFGWVDSLIKRLDDRRFARKFTPRRADSRWSGVNRKRYAELKAARRLKAPGIARPPTDRGCGPRPKRLEMLSKLPAYIQTALQKHPAAMRHFDALPPEQRRRYYAWIESAKREETKLRRLAEAIRLLSSGKVLGLK